jgi:RNA polymerase sigma-70 factor (ECF subfamily)
VREASKAKDLADSLYGDLYGTQEREGRRMSKLAMYMGRGSLEGWLRTVLAQEYVNRYRSQRRLVSLEEEEEAGSHFAAPEQTPVPAADPRLDSAVDEALATLDPESRTILSAYYLDGRKLAEIGRMLGFHEATASRKLERITKGLRRAIREALVRQGMSKRQAEEALEVDVRDLSINVRERLSQESGP